MWRGNQVVDLDRFETKQEMRTSTWNFRSKSSHISGEKPWEAHVLRAIKSSNRYVYEKNSILVFLACTDI